MDVVVKYLKNRFIYLPVLTIFLLVMALTFRQILDADIGFHLRGGQWMLESASFHRHDVFTYTVRGNEYIAMYWLFQILLYLTYKATGYGGLSVLNSMLILVVFLLIYIRLRQHKVPLDLIMPFILAAVLAMEIRFGVRPEVYTWLCMSLLLIVLDLYYHRNKNYLYFLPVIMLAWVNLHGLFIIGWGLLAAYFISLWVKEKKVSKPYTFWSLSAVLATFLNPYFVKGILFPFYLFTRLQQSNIFKGAITELTSPWSAKALAFMPRLPLVIYYVLAVVSVVVLLVTIRRRKPHETIIIIAFIYLSITAVRNVPLFIIAVCPVMGVSIVDITMKMANRFLAKSLSTRMKRILSISTRAIVPLVALLFCLRVFTNSYYAERGGGNFGFGLDYSVQPVAAAEFLVKNGLTGRVVNDLNRGSWLIWKIPQPVFIDGRLEVIREDFFKEYQKSFEANGLKNLIEKYNPQIFMFDYSYPEALIWDFQLIDLGWRLIYVDGTSAIYAREDYMLEFRDVFINLPAALKKREIADDRKEWNSLRIKRDCGILKWLEGFFKHSSYHADWRRLALFTAVHSRFDYAKNIYLSLLADKSVKTDLGQLYFELGAVYYVTGDLAKAEYCLRWVLEKKPTHEKANKMLKEITGR